MPRAEQAASRHGRNGTRLPSPPAQHSAALAPEVLPVLGASRSHAAVDIGQFIEFAKRGGFRVLFFPASFAKAPGHEHFPGTMTIRAAWPASARSPTQSTRRASAWGCTSITQKPARRSYVTPVPDDRLHAVASYTLARMPRQRHRSPSARTPPAPARRRSPDSETGQGVDRIRGLSQRRAVPVHRLRRSLGTRPRAGRGDRGPARRRHLAGVHPLRPGHRYPG